MTTNASVPTPTIATVTLRNFVVLYPDHDGVAHLPVVAERVFTNATVIFLIGDDPVAEFNLGEIIGWQDLGEREVN